MWDVEKNGKFTMRKLKLSLLFYRKSSLLTSCHCQLICVGQIMKQMWLYMWCPLNQVQWDTCYQRSHDFILIFIYLTTENL